MVTSSLTLTATETTAVGWQLAYRRALWISDSVVIITAVFLSQFLWFTIIGERVTQPVDDTPLTYTWLSVVLILAWLLALSLSGSRSERVIGMGMAEYRLVISSAVHVFALLAIVSYVTMTP